MFGITDPDFRSDGGLLERELWLCKTNIKTALGLLTHGVPQGGDDGKRSLDGAIRTLEKTNEVVRKAMIRLGELHDLMKKEL